MHRSVQYFSDEYLQDCKKMSSSQILKFLENYRKLHIDPGPLVQINMRVSKNILAAFKARAKREGISYQKKIKELMSDWLLD